FLGHGDGLGPGDKKYKFLKSIFSNRLCQWLFERIHPNLGIALANFWSKRSRLTEGSPKQFLGEDKEHLILFCKEKIKEAHFDYFIFGHRHIPLNIEIPSKEGESRYINLGDWLQHDSYAVFDGNEVRLEYFKK
ncbi:MAG: UDP-2,3-diacylglucosamine diphosphatase, partial [Flavobacteriales bacterium]